MAAITTMDLIVLCIGVLVGLLAIVAVVLVIYYGYCRRLCDFCQSYGGDGSSGYARHHDHGSGKEPVLTSRGHRLSTEPLTSADMLSLPIPVPSDCGGAVIPSDIDHRPALTEPAVSPIEEEQASPLELGMVFLPGQALKDLPGGDYPIPVPDSVEGRCDDGDNEAPPPLTPRRDSNWSVVKERMLKPREVVMVEAEKSGKDADHGEEHYTTLGGNFRYLAPKKVEVLEEIGSGQFGTIHRGIWTKNSGEEVVVALKCLKEDGKSDYASKKLLSEGRLQGQFDHPNVTKLFGFLVYDDQVALALEFLSGGSLVTHLSKLRPEADSTFDESLPHKLLQLSRDVAAGLAYLSEQNFVHRDLAARNVLIAHDSTAKISDFGMSHLLADDHYYTARGGKLPYKWCPPEVINYRKFSKASDVWSFGIVLYEIWSFGRKPYFPWDSKMVLKRVCEGYRLPPPPGCSRKTYTVMMNCWHPDRRKRPEASQLVETLKQDSSGLVQLDSAARRRLTGAPEQAYRLGAGVEHSQSLYSEITVKYSHIDHDIGGMD